MCGEKGSGVASVKSRETHFTYNELRVGTGTWRECGGCERVEKETCKGKTCSEWEGPCGRSKLVSGRYEWASRG